MDTPEFIQRIAFFVCGGLSVSNFLAKNVLRFRLNEQL